MSVVRVRKLVETSGAGWVARGLSGPTSETLRALADEAGWLFAQADVNGISDREELFDVLSSSLNLPEYFGRNWDALADSLSDVGQGHPGAIVRLKGLNTIPPELAEPLVDILQGRVDEARDSIAGPFIVVADPPLPATAAVVPGS